MKTSDEPIIVEQTFDVSSQRLWNALTELNEIRKWFFPNINAFQPKLGFETEFIVKTAQRTFPHLWKVIEIIPQKKMVQEWRYGAYDGMCHITFELLELDKKTKLALTATVLEDFPDDIPEFKRESGVAGWEYFIKKSLKAYLSQN